MEKKKVKAFLSILAVIFFLLFLAKDVSGLSKEKHQNSQEIGETRKETEETRKGTEETKKQTDKKKNGTEAEDSKNVEDEKNIEDEKNRQLVNLINDIMVATLGHNIIEMYELLGGKDIENPSDKDMKMLTNFQTDFIRVIRDGEVEEKDISPSGQA